MSYKYIEQKAVNIYRFTCDNVNCRKKVRVISEGNEPAPPKRWTRTSTATLCDRCSAKSKQAGKGLPSGR